MQGVGGGWMRLIYFISAVLFLALPAQASFDPFVGRKPLAVLIEQSPWVEWVNWDTPRIAVYDDGEVIFWRESTEDSSYQIAQLSSFELESVKKKLAALSAISVKQNYSLSDRRDQINTQIYIENGDNDAVINGYEIECDHVPARNYDESEIYPPLEFFQIHSFLCQFKPKLSKSWTPDYIEVVLWDGQYATEKSIYWPEEWPNLSSDRALLQDNRWSLFLNWSEAPKLFAFLETRPKKGAIQIGGKKWIASVRYTLPNEPVWRRALRAQPDEM